MIDEKVIFWIYAWNENRVKVAKKQVYIDNVIHNYENKEMWVNEQRMDDHKILLIKNKDHQEKSQVIYQWFQQRYDNAFGKKHIPNLHNDD